ncbi:MAG: hypothetical protein ACLFP8_06505 [Alphaproteobacteria bacterium]
MDLLVTKAFRKACKKDPALKIKIEKGVERALLNPAKIRRFSGTSDKILSVELSGHNRVLLAYDPQQEIYVPFFAGSHEDYNRFFYCVPRAKDILAAQTVSMKFKGDVGYLNKAGAFLGHSDGGKVLARLKAKEQRAPEPS